MYSSAWQLFEGVVSPIGIVLDIATIILHNFDGGKSTLTGCWIHRKRFQETCCAPRIWQPIARCLHTEFRTARLGPLFDPNVSGKNLVSFRSVDSDMHDGDKQVVAHGSHPWALRTSVVLECSCSVPLDVKVVAANDPFRPLDYMVYQLKYDNVHGRVNRHHRDV